jgi:hypothetical protein
MTLGYNQLGTRIDRLPRDPVELHNFDIVTNYNQCKASPLSSGGLGLEGSYESHGTLSLSKKSAFSPSSNPREEPRICRLALATNS